MLPILFIITFVGGLILGILFGYYLLKGRAKLWFKEWKLKEEDRIRKDVIKRSRATLKGKVGEQIAPLFDVFDYEPSDARFIGSPVDYVIFEGHSTEEPKGITFADVKTGETSGLTRIQRGFKEVVEKGKVNWDTIYLREPGSEK